MRASKDYVRRRAPRGVEFTPRELRRHADSAAACANLNLRMSANRYHCKLRCLYKVDTPEANHFRETVFFGAAENHLGFFLGRFLGRPNIIRTAMGQFLRRPKITRTTMGQFQCGRKSLVRPCGSFWGDRTFPVRLHGAAEGSLMQPELQNIRTNYNKL